MYLAIMMLNLNLKKIKYNLYEYFCVIDMW